MAQPQIIGLVTIGLGMLILCWLLFRRRRGAFLVALLLCAGGLAYLATTPTPTEVARTIFGQKY